MLVVSTAQSVPDQHDQLIASSAVGLPLLNLVANAISICAGSGGYPLRDGHLIHERCRNLIDPRSIKISDLHS